MSTTIGTVARKALATKVGGTLARLFRYSATSVICLAISEAVVMILVGTGLTGATSAALIGSFAGVPPSYLMSRYWIWRDADRKNTTRQIILYWVVSLSAIGITSFATGFVAHHSNSKGGEHVEIVGGAFLAFNVILWLAKYAMYHFVIFRNSEPELEPSCADRSCDTPVGIDSRQAPLSVDPAIHRGELASGSRDDDQLVTTGPVEIIRSRRSAT